MCFVFQPPPPLSQKWVLYFLHASRRLQRSHVRDSGPMFSMLCMVWRALFASSALRMLSSSVVLTKIKSIIAHYSDCIKLHVFILLQRPSHFNCVHPILTTSADRFQQARLLSSTTCLAVTICTQGQRPPQAVSPAFFMQRRKARFQAMS